MSGIGINEISCDCDEHVYRRNDTIMTHRNRWRLRSWSDGPQLGNHDAHDGDNMCESMWWSGQYERETGIET